MNRYLAMAASLGTVLLLLGCGGEPESSGENRPAGIGSEDSTATPGTRPRGTDEAESAEEARERIPPTD